MVDRDATVGQHGLEVAVAEREPEGPAHGPEVDLGREAVAAERPGGGHGRCSRMRGRWERRSYPLTAPRSTQRNPLDETAAAALAHLLARRGFGARTLPCEAASFSNFAGLEREGVALVCLSYVNPRSLQHARRLVRRLRQHFRDGVPIVLGLWNAEPPRDESREAFAATGADWLATSLPAAVDGSRRCSGRRPSPRRPTQHPRPRRLMRPVRGWIRGARCSGRGRPLATTNCAHRDPRTGLLIPNPREPFRSASSAQSPQAGPRTSATPSAGRPTGC